MFLMTEYDEYFNAAQVEVVNVTTTANGMYALMVHFISGHKLEIGRYEKKEQACYFLENLAATLNEEKAK